MTQLERQVARLGDAFDNNSEVFVDSLKVSESMLATLQKVFEERVHGQEFTYARDNGCPDWASYLRYYWMCMLMSDFATWLMSIHVEDVPEATLTGPNERVVETHIFGG